MSNANRHDRYRVLPVATWKDPKLLALTRMPPSGQALFLYLLTGPHNKSALPGLFPFWADQAAATLAWERSDVIRVMREIVTSGLVRWTETDGVCWIPSVFEYELPTSPSVAAAWAKEARTLPECELVAEAIASIDERLRESLHPTVYAEWRRCLGEDGGGR